MKCSPRSIISRASALTLLSLLACAASAASLPESAPPLQDVLERAILTRLGGHVRVTLGDVRVVSPWLRGDVRVARLEPGRRLGGVMRFLLFDSEEAAARFRAVGVADAEVHVSAPHLRTTTAIARGTVLDAADVEHTDDDVGRLALEAWPPLADVVGSEARRDLQAGEVLIAPLVIEPRLVKAGAEVDLVVHLAGVEVRSRAVAAQAGRRGETIRVVNADSGRAVRGVIVGANVVEVTHGR